MFPKYSTKKEKSEFRALKNFLFDFREEERVTFSFPLISPWCQHVDKRTCFLTALFLMVFSKRIKCSLFSKWMEFIR